MSILLLPSLVCFLSSLPCCLFPCTISHLISVTILLLLTFPCFIVHVGGLCSDMRARQAQYPDGVIRSMADILLQRVSQYCAVPFSHTPSWFLVELDHLVRLCVFPCTV